MVVASHSVGAKGSTACAPVDQPPFIFTAYPYGYGFHEGPALSSPVTGFYVQMHTEQAPRAVVSLLSAASIPRDENAAIAACESLWAGAWI